MRVRFLIFFALVALVAIVGVVLSIRVAAPELVRTYLFRGGMLGAENLVRSLENYYNRNQSWEGVDSVFAQFHMQGQMGMGNHHRFAMMTDLMLSEPDGRVIYSSDPGQVNTVLSEDILERSIRLTGPRSKTIGYLVVAGGGVALPGDETSLLQAINTAALRAGLIALAVALVLALVLAGSLLRPVRELTQAARNFAAGNLSQRVNVAGDEEIRQLALSFNQMAEFLQQSEIRRKSLTADIAHELRTPLAVQGAQIEAMLDKVYELNDENLARVLEQNRLLTRLVEDLRMLAMADAGELRLDMVPLDLAALSDRVVERFRMLAGDRQIHFLNKTGRALFVNGDPSRLEQILSNLLSNAIRYTPAGGQVWLTLETPDQHHVDLSVRDSGAGIPPEALDRIFDRFYRAESSRARSEGGSGLGLAIARQLALAHLGSLKAENHPQGGAVLRLTLPLIEAGGTEVDQK